MEIYRSTTFGIQSSRSSSEMADSTSFMILQKSKEKLDLIFNQAMHQISEIFENTSQMVTEIATAKSRWVDPPPSYIEDARQKNWVSNSKEQSDTYTLEKQVYNSLPDLDFPSFDGFLPRAWNIKCMRYLTMLPNNSDRQKIIWAAMKFEGRAADWFKTMRDRILGLTWQQFVDWVLARFYDFNETQIFCEFDRLKHANTYAEFIYYFGKLRTALELLNPGENIECYYLANFLNELGDEHKLSVAMPNPQDLYQQIIVKGVMKSYPEHHPSSSANMTDLTQVTQETEPSSKQPTKLLANSRLTDKKIQDLCDGEYSLEQKCMHEITYKGLPASEEVVHSVIVENILDLVGKEAVEVTANPGEGLKSARKLVESTSWQQTSGNDLPPVPIQLLPKVSEVTESVPRHDVDEDFFPVSKSNQIFSSIISKGCEKIASLGNMKVMEDFSHDFILKNELLLCSLPNVASAAGLFSLECDSCYMNITKEIADTVLYWDINWWELGKMGLSLEIVTTSYRYGGGINNLLNLHGEYCGNDSPEAYSATDFEKMEGLMSLPLELIEDTTYYCVPAVNPNKLQFSQISEIQTEKAYHHNQFKIKEECKWEKFLHMKLQYDGQIRKFQLSFDDLSKTDKLLRSLSTSQVWYGIWYNGETSMKSEQVIPMTVIEFDRQLMFQHLKENLKQAQNWMKTYANKSRTEKKSKVGDYVYLKHKQLYQQNSIGICSSLKLSSYYYGPYKRSERVRSMACILELPDTSEVHLVLHIFLLKKNLGDEQEVLSQLPELDVNGVLAFTPIQVLDTRHIIHGRNVMRLSLVVTGKEEQVIDEDLAGEDGGEKVGLLGELVVVRMRAVSLPKSPMPSSDGRFLINQISNFFRQTVMQRNESVLQVLIPSESALPTHDDGGVLLLNHTVPIAPVPFQDSIFEDFPQLAAAVVSFSPKVKADPWGQGSLNGGSIVMNPLISDDIRGIEVDNQGIEVVEVEKLDLDLGISAGSHVASKDEWIKAENGLFGLFNEGNALSG